MNNNQLTNLLFNSLLYLYNNIKKNNSNSSTNTLNLDAYPFSRDNSHTSYVKKKSSFTNINKINKNKKEINKRHTKNKSISSSISGIQRTSKENINYLYTAQNNRIGKYLKNKSIIVPEYTMKLENIKSRISNLLNIYSLLALRSINSTNNNNS